MANVKRKQGSNQYVEKYEKADPAERRLPRKRKKAMKQSSVNMATPGKPFQCPGCRKVHSTGFVCEVCSPNVQVLLITCPGCNAAVIPTGELVCENCALAAGRYAAPRQPVGVGSPIGALPPPSGPRSTGSWSTPSPQTRAGSRPIPRRNN